MEVVALVLAILAVALGLMAIPPILQMIWGKPRITIAFTTHSRDGSKALTCSVSNPPVTNRLLKVLGVTRRAAVGTITGFSISEYGTGRIVVPNIAEELASTPNAPAVPVLHFVASRISSGFPVAIMETKQAKVHSLDAALQRHDLPPGTYVCRVKIMWGSDKKEAERSFVLGASPETFEWVSC
jgi:hypothetical protein